MISWKHITIYYRKALRATGCAIRERATPPAVGINRAGIWIGGADVGLGGRAAVEGPSGGAGGGAGGAMWRWERRCVAGPWISTSALAVGARGGWGVVVWRCSKAVGGAGAGAGGGQRKEAGWWRGARGGRSRGWRKEADGVIEEDDECCGRGRVITRSMYYSYSVDYLGDVKIFRGAIPVRCMQIFVSRDY
jgi:hypothetical protein